PRIASTHGDLPLRLAARPHAAELQQQELLPSPAHTHLTEEGATGRGKGNGQGQQDEYRGKQYQCRCGEHDIEQALGHVLMWAMCACRACDAHMVRRSVPRSTCA